MNRARFCLSVFVLVLTACGPDTASSSFGDRDWSDVTHEITGVENAPGLEVDEVWRIGLGADTVGQLQSIRSISGDRSALYVLDGQAQSLLIYDSVGGFVRRIGGKGRGPGELWLAWDVNLSNDTLFILDESLHLFDRRGNYLDRSQPRNIRMAFDGMPTPVGLALMRRWFESSGTGWIADTIFVSYLDVRSGREPAAVVKTGSTLYYKPEMGVMSPRAGGALPQTHLLASGRVIVSDPEFFSFRVYSSDGRLIEHFMAELPRVPVSRQDIFDFVDANPFPAGHEDEMRSARLKAPRARYLPQARSLTASPQGHLLIERPDLSPRPFAFEDGSLHSVWLLLDPQRRPVGNVTLNRRFKPMLFHDCLVTGAEPDSLDTPIVVRYRIRGCSP